MTKVEILRAAANHIRQKGFSIYLEEGAEGPCCFIGSICRAAGVDPYKDQHGVVDEVEKLVQQTLEEAGYGIDVDSLWHAGKDGWLNRTNAADFLDDLAVFIEAKL